MKAQNMTQSDTHASVQDVALIVGGGPGIGSSCAKLFANDGIHVAMAPRNADKPVLQNLANPRSLPSIGRELGHDENTSDF